MQSLHDSIQFQGYIFANSGSAIVACSDADNLIRSTTCHHKFAHTKLRQLDVKHRPAAPLSRSSTSLAAQHSILVRASWSEIELNSLGIQENSFLVPRFSLVVSTGVLYPEFSISQVQGQCFFCSIPEAWMLWTRKLRVLEAQEGLWNVNKKKFWAVQKALEV